MAMASIDNLAPTRSLIDLSNPDRGDFGIDDFELSFIFDDILLIEYIDETAEGEVERNGILVPTNALTKAWRKGKVILAGPDAKYAITKGIFLNEERMFGICKQKNVNTESSS